MRPDLIRLLVDTRRKELVTETDGDHGVREYSTRERLGLNSPLDPPKQEKVPSFVSKSSLKEPEARKTNGL